MVQIMLGKLVRQANFKPVRVAIEALLEEGPKHSLWRNDPREVEERRKIAQTRHRNMVEAEAIACLRAKSVINGGIIPPPKFGEIGRRFPGTKYFIAQICSRRGEENIDTVLGTGLTESIAHLRHTRSVETTGHQVSGRGWITGLGCAEFSMSTSWFTQGS